MDEKSSRDFRDQLKAQEKVMEAIDLEAVSYCRQQEGCSRRSF
jgi:hypothetical protein